MPLYYFVDQKTQEPLKKHFSYEEMEQFLKDNPHIVRDFTGSGFQVDPIRTGITKPPEAFRDILRNIKKEHRNVLSGGTPGINTF